MCPCRGFREDATEEPDVDEEAGGDASLIDVEAEKRMAEEASKYRIHDLAPSENPKLYLVTERRRDELDIMYGDESEEEALYDKTGKYI